MAFFGKEYKLVKSENYEGFLKALGVADDKIGAYLNTEVSEKYTKNGDSYTIEYISSEGNMAVNFKLGVEIDETIDDLSMKSTYTIDGNTMNQVMKMKDSTAHTKREFNGNDLTMTLTSDKWDGVARLFFKS